MHAGIAGILAGLAVLGHTCAGFVRKRLALEGSLIGLRQRARHIAKARDTG